MDASSNSANRANRDELVATKEKDGLFNRNLAVAKEIASVLPM
jgi:hypothetical protein